MKSRFSVAVVGGGITGLTCAALLSKGANSDALDITVIDAGERPVISLADDIALRVSAIAIGSAELLDSVGAWDEVVRARVSPYEKMQVWDESDAPGSGSVLTFDAAEFATAQLGFIVENDLLRDALLTQLDLSGVALHFGRKLESMPAADLVIGADGARSFVRKLAGIETTLWPYRQTAVVTHLEAERSHERTAWQRFLRSGPLGMLPLCDGRVSVVWSTSEAEAKCALEVSNDELGRMLGRASDGVLGELRVAGAKGAFPLCAQHAERYVQSGIALIGDAAHAIHPLAGQGANLGLRDAAELARVVDTAVADGLQPGDRPVLRRYERARKGDNLTMLHVMTGLNRLFATDSAVVGGLRSAGMRAFNRSGPIKEHVVKVALGVNQRP